MTLRGHLAWLIRWQRRHWHYMLAEILCISVAGVVLTIDPLLLRVLIDRALPLRDYKLSFKLVGGIGVCYVVRTALYSLGGLSSLSVLQRCTCELRSALLDKMSHLSADYHEATSVGDKVTRLEYDVRQIAELSADSANQSIRAIVFLTVNLVAMAWMSPAMTLMVAPLLPLFVFCQRMFRTVIRERADRVRDKVSETSNDLTEFVCAVPQIQLLGAEEFARRKTDMSWSDLLSAQWKQRRMEIAFAFSMSSILAVAIVVVLGAGTSKVFESALSVGELIAFYTYVTRVFEPINAAADFLTRLQRVGASVHRIRETLTLQPSIVDSGKTEVSLPVRDGLECVDVCFCYGSKRVFQNISLKIPAGHRVGIIGRSGSGKSTLARLLVRVISPEPGRVILDGRTTSEYSLASLRKAVCYVPQHPFLFSGTIRENLLYGDPGASEDALQRAIAAVGLDTVASSLPSGIDAELEPGAGNLSGGERQRLAIARALLRKSSILILDEATSALDLPAERFVLRGVATFQPDLTLIVISHRISSLVWMDRLILLDKGRIARVGRHTELYRDSELYRSLFHASGKKSAAELFDRPQSQVSLDSALKQAW